MIQVILWVNNAVILDKEYDSEREAAQVLMAHWMENTAEEGVLKINGKIAMQFGPTSIES